MVGWDARRYRLTQEGLAALLRRHGLGGNEAWLLQTLADFDHRERATGLRKGVVWPTLGMLADRSGLTIRAVRTARDKLARSELITVTPLTPELNGCQDRGPTVTLHWDRLLGEDPAATRRGDPVTRQGGCNNVESQEATVVVAISAAGGVGADGDDDCLDAAAGPATPGGRPADPPNPPAPLPAAEPLPRAGAREAGRAGSTLRPPDQVLATAQTPTPKAGHPDWLVLLSPTEAGVPAGDVHKALCKALPTHGALERFLDLLGEELDEAKAAKRKVSWERRIELARIATVQTTPGRARPRSPGANRETLAELAQQERADLAALIAGLAAAEAQRGADAVAEGALAPEAGARPARPPVVPPPPLPPNAAPSNPAPLPLHLEPVAADDAAAAVPCV